MSAIFKLAGFNASDYAYVNNANQELIYSASQEYIGRAIQHSNEMMSAFVEESTTNYKERYQLPMGGRMQRTGTSARGAAVSSNGGWDVAYPLHNFSDLLATSDAKRAYWTPQDLQNHVDGIIGRWHRARLFESLHALFNNNQKTVVDEFYGSLTIERLAAGDAGVLYPPVEGSDSEATDNHYLESNYASASISDTNNPIKTMVTELVEHGVNRTEDVPVVTFIHSDEQDVVEALTNFVPYVPPMKIQAGMDTDQVLMPSRPVPGKIIGYVRGQSWVSVWNEIPSGYMLAVNLANAAPLKMRVDPEGTGLGMGGLQLLPVEREGVITFQDWRARFGMGVGNRLGAVVMELGTGGTYTIPTKFQ
jgi:hypothetical protein